jgi:hypothetical protein
MKFFADIADTAEIKLPAAFLADRAKTGQQIA